MKKFNQVIKIEVSVDAIADQLLSNISVDFKHRDSLVEVIIGNALQNNIAMTQMYNALNGHSNDIDFKIGEAVTCTETEWSGDKRQVIGCCTIININLHSAEKLEVSFINSVGKKTSKWVKHTSCGKSIPREVVA
jgi:hypothetical protein